MEFEELRKILTDAGLTREDAVAIECAIELAKESTKFRVKYGTYMQDKLTRLFPTEPQ